MNGVGGGGGGALNHLPLLFCKSVYIFEISRPRALKWYIICPYFKSSKFFWTAFLETLRSHFAKIAHKIAKSKYFSNIQNESYLLWNFPFQRYIVCWGKIYRSKIIGEGDAPSHLRLLFCKIVYFDWNIKTEDYRVEVFHIVWTVHVPKLN